MKKTNFDKKLFEAWNNEKKNMGVSADAVCWFKSSNLNIPNKKSVDCLIWFNLYLTPHSNEEKKESTKIQLKDNILCELLLSNSCAIEIINNSF